MNKAASTVRGVQRAKARKQRQQAMKWATARAAKVAELNHLIDNGNADERVAAARTKRGMHKAASTTMPTIQDLRGPKDWKPFNER